MATLVGKTIASTYYKLFVRSGTVPSTGTTTTQVTAQNDSGVDVTLPLYISTERVGIGDASPDGLLEIENPSDGGHTCLTIDNDDTDEIAINIEAANIDADVMDIGADALTTAHVIDITAAALTTGSAIKVDCGSTALATTATGGLVEIIHDVDSDSNTNNLLYIINDHADSTGTTCLYVNQDSTGPAAVFDGGNVGIGTASPAAKLQVHGTGANVVRFSDDGSTTQLDFDISAGAYGLMGMNTNHPLHFQTNNGIRMSILAAGNVGIGTNAPTSALHVEKSVTENFAAFIYQTRGVHADDGGLKVKTSSTACDSFLVDNSGTTNFVIQGDGKVGIGTATPEYNLEVENDGTEVYIAISAHSNTSSHAPNLVFKKSDDTEAAPAPIDSGDIMGRIEFVGFDDNSYETGCRIYAKADNNWGASQRGTDLHFQTRDEDAGLNDAMTISAEAYVGVKNTNPQYVLHPKEDNDNTMMQMQATHASFANKVVDMAVDREANAEYQFLYATSNHSAGADPEFRVSGIGEIFSDTTAHGGAADYAEYFETSDGNAISPGITVVIVDGKIRPAMDGESPIGVLRPEGASVVVGGSYWNKWRNKYLRTDYGNYVLDKNGDRTLNPEFVENLDKEGNQIYSPTSERDEWQIVGLVGQVGINKGQPVASSWIKMSEISDSVDMYYIFPCAQTINNNQTGDSSNGQEPESAGSGDSGGDSESPGEDSGGAEAGSSDSSDSASGTSEASESSSDDGDESSGSSGSDASNDSEGGSGGDDSGGTPSGEPSAEWTKSQLKEYMIDNAIAFNSGDTKDDLLMKIDNADSGEES